MLVVLWCCGPASADSWFVSQQDSLVRQFDEVAPVPLRVFDERALAEYKEDPAFDYATERAAGPSWFGLFLFWLLSKIAEILNISNGDWWIESLLNLLMIFGIIAAVALILRMRFGSALTSSAARGGVSGAVPELGQQHDYESLFQEALNSGDLKLASRYLYIKTLQALHGKGLVNLMKWKTMPEYTQELPAEKQPLFSKIGLLFEATWYGNYEPSEADFQEGISSSNELIR